jgi:ABC-2 type transport system ATP-binding protein
VLACFIGRRTVEDAEAPSMIKIDNLTKVFSRGQRPAIDSVSMEVRDGEIVGFVGLNGAGKTTTIRIASGVSLPTSGSVSIDGHDLTTQKVEASKHIGWVPEIPNFEPNSRADSLMEYFAGFYGISRDDAASRSSQLLKSVGLEGSEKMKVRAYSQGMKKRFALAASMLGDPRNFLFDEVLNGLDPEGIRFFRQLILDFRGHGKAVLLSSHILVEIEGLADRIVIIHKGKVIKTVSRAELAEAGKAAIKVVVPNLDEKALNFMRGLGDLRVEGNTAFLIAKGLSTTRVNTELQKMGYEVSEISQQKEGLEEYFLHLIAEGS